MKKSRKILLSAVVLILAFSIQSLFANGQGEAEGVGAEAVAAWPDKDVMVYIPNPPGSNLDLSVRIMLDYLNSATGKTFIPVNEVTGMGTLALQKVSGAKPDGYTIMFTGSGSNIQFDTKQTDINTLDPNQITIIGTSGGLKVDFDSVLVTTPGKPYKTFDQFVSYVNANPGKVNYGTSSGTTVEVKARLVLNEFSLADKVKLVYSPSTEIAIGLLGGSIDAAVVSGQSALQYLQDGSFIPLMHTIDKYTGNNPAFKGVPTYTDLGCPELYSAFPMYVVGPGNMNEDLVLKINQIMAGAASSADHVARWDKMHSIFIPKSPEDIRNEIKAMDDNIRSVFSE